MSKLYFSSSSRKYFVPPSTLACGSNALGTPSSDAVPGINCISPRAPLGETACALKSLSALMTLFTRSGSSRYRPLASFMTWFRSITGRPGNPPGAIASGRERGREVTAGTWVIGVGSSDVASKCSICDVGTSTKLDPSLFMYSRVTSPTTSRRSCLMENPFFRTATSAAKQGSVTIARIAKTPAAFRTCWMQYIDHGQIARRVLGPQHRYLPIHPCGLERSQGRLHAIHRPAKHRLHRIGDQRVFDRHDELDVFHILFQPAPNAHAQLIEPFQRDRALGFLVKC